MAPQICNAETLVSRCSLLACDSLALTALRSGICTSLLAADWQSLAMPRATVALDVSDAAYVHLRFSAQVALYDVAHGIHLVPDASELVLGEVADALARINTELARYP